MKSETAFIWVHRETTKVVVVDGFRRRPDDNTGWCDPIGAAYSDWARASVQDRMLLMTETVIDLVMQGFDCGAVLREFAKVDEFKAIGNDSHPMCRALTKALTGKGLDMVTMSFDELLRVYGQG